ncbi:hypothetical protein KY284_007903 [Solanum tuberosum]|nr:hypothetical protein KY284_007903 [Solanum tuberosum]
MAKRPPYVPERQLKELIKYWDCDKHKKMAETKSRNRKKLMKPHTAGKISFALVRNNLEKKKESNVSLKELFLVTRTRHPERSYEDSNEDSISKIEGKVNKGMKTMKARLGRIELISLELNMCSRSLLIFGY